MMRAQIVSFHCVLKDKLGNVLSSSFNQDVINQLQDGGHVLEGLVSGLQDLIEGETRQIYVPADRGYGLYNPELVAEFRREELLYGHELKVGSEVLMKSTSDGHSRIFRIINASDDFVVLDGNHPLAGRDLIFEVSITAAREASADDLVRSPFCGSSRYMH